MFFVQLFTNFLASIPFLVFCCFKIDFPFSMVSPQFFQFSVTKTCHGAHKLHVAFKVHFQLNGNILGIIMFIIISPAIMSISTHTCLSFAISEIVVSGVINNLHLKHLYMAGSPGSSKIRSRQGSVFYLFVPPFRLSSCLFIPFLAKMATVNW